MLKKRNGLISLLHTLFFISILFSAIKPMRGFTQQTNYIQELKKQESDNLELLRKNEHVKVYPIPHLTYDLLYVRIINQCEYPVHFVRVWINDTYIIVDETADPYGIIDVGGFPLTPAEGGIYEIRVTSDRGNVFISHIGYISYRGGEWINDVYEFNLLFPSRLETGVRYIE